MGNLDPLFGPHSWGLGRGMREVGDEGSRKGQKALLIRVEAAYLRYFCVDIFLQTCTDKNSL